MLQWKHDIPTRYFATYEALEEAFRERIAGLVPRYHAGTRVFWEDFQQLYDNPERPGAEDDEAYITINPRDCLAFGTPYQVLQAAWLAARQHPAAPSESPRQVAEKFGLGGQRHQAMRSLSGGETVRLALAKAYLAARHADRLTIASPFSWLSLDHWTDFRLLAAHYRDCGTPLELFALEGEDSTAPAPSGRAPAPLAFDWRLKGLRLDLGTMMDHLHERPVWAGVAPRDETLDSPCLLCGDNGQGKSLVAKTLAAAMPFSGEASVHVSGAPARARLLFQDVFNQALMRSMRQLTSRGPTGPVAAVYDEILAGMGTPSAAGRAPNPSFRVRQRDGNPPSLLELKMLLTAVRLAAGTTVLILDEPDWGLSRSDAVAFVTAVVHAAHARSVPLILISHKPWWQNLARSVRWFRKETPAAPDAGGCLFQIHIQDRPGGAP